MNEIDNMWEEGDPEGLWAHRECLDRYDAERQGANATAFQRSGSRQTGPRRPGPDKRNPDRQGTALEGLTRALYGPIRPYKSFIGIYNALQDLIAYRTL